MITRKGKIILVVMLLALMIASGIKGYELYQWHELEVVEHMYE